MPDSWASLILSLRKIQAKKFSMEISVMLSREHMEYAYYI